MDHSEIKRKILEIYDGDFVEKEPAQACRDHLATCSECAAELELWKGLRSRFQQWPSPALSDGFERSVLSEIKGNNEAGLGLIIGKWLRGLKPPVWQVWTTGTIFAACMIYSVLPFGAASDAHSQGHPIFYSAEGELMTERFFSPESIGDEEAASLMLGDVIE